MRGRTCIRLKAGLAHPGGQGQRVPGVAKGWQDVCHLPAYPRHRQRDVAAGDTELRDSGSYRCQVVRGIEDSRDLVPLEVTGQLGEGEGSRLGRGSALTGMSS